MGREIRRVPQGWEHPKEDGRFLPMFDKDYETVRKTWVEELLLWQEGKHPKQDSDWLKSIDFWEYDNTPDRETCRPAFETEPICYQMYETVSEGTPTSPVFETEEEMIDWLVQQGHSSEAAQIFVEKKWAPSFISDGNRMAANVDAYDIWEKETER